MPILHTQSETFDGNGVSNKILFKNITYVDTTKIKQGTRKLILNMKKYNLQSDSVVFNVQQFQREANGQWLRILNMGNFTITQENIGNIDNKKMCDLMLDMAITAQYK